MNTRRPHFMVAGGLLLATVLAGAATRVTGHSPMLLLSTNGKTNFAAPKNGRVSFAGTLDRTAVMRGRDGLARMELVMAAAPDDSPRGERRPTDMMIVLDRSGSMSGDKIVQARAAVLELLAQLEPHDRFGLVTYSDSATLSIPLSTVDEGLRTVWAGTVSEVQPSGGTNMSSGLDVALDTIERNRQPARVPRVILISDGLANQGDSTPEGLVRRARRAAQGEYMLSTVGIGADFNEYLMTALADAGTGNYYYVQDTRDLASVVAREFSGARSTIASALAVRIDPADGVRIVDAAGYPLETDGNSIVFRPGSLFAGQERRVWITLAVPQQAVGTYDLGVFALSYGEGNERVTLRFDNMPRIACVQGEDEFFAGIDKDAWSRSVVVDAYNKMQEDVAREVKAGRRDAALHRLHAFKEETSALNDHVKSAPVAGQILSLGKFEADVQGAFVGPDQAQRQNELSKAASALGTDGRRAGSKK